MGRPPCLSIPPIPYPPTTDYYQYPPPSSGGWRHPPSAGPGPCPRGIRRRASHTSTGWLPGVINGGGNGGGGVMYIQTGTHPDTHTRTHTHPKTHADTHAPTRRHDMARRTRLHTHTPTQTPTHTHTHTNTYDTRLRVLAVVLQKGEEEAAVLELRDERHVALVPKDGVEEDAPDKKGGGGVVGGVVWVGGCCWGCCWWWWWLLGLKLEVWMWVMARRVVPPHTCMHCHHPSASPQTPQRLTRRAPGP